MTVKPSSVNVWLYRLGDGRIAMRGLGPASITPAVKKAALAYAEGAFAQREPSRNILIINVPLPSVPSLV